MSELYEYSPLAANSIRLIYVAPRKEEDPAGRCEIKTYALENLPSFEALSYTWGVPEFTHQVLVGGKRLPITANLAGALDRIRHETETKVIWIDAISINQNDVHERTQQVQLMASIYSKARQVLIYLGTMTSDVPDAMALLVKMFKRALEENQEHEAGGPPITERRYPSAADNEKWGLPPFGSPDWDALAQFFSRGWFKRVWIVQEVRVALDAQILIGDDQVPWKYIFVASSWFNTHNYKYVAGKGRLAGHVGVASLPSRIGCHRLVETNPYRVPLSELLRSIRPNGATDPRDKVFAFIGLATEGQENHPLLRPDYSKTMAEVYRDASRYLIDMEGNLGILSAVCYVPDTRSPLTWAKEDIEVEGGILTHTTPVWGPPDETIIFPSWVPRWDCPDITYPLATSSRDRNHFHASGDLRLCSLPSPDANVLILGGLSFDRTSSQTEILSEKFEPSPAEKTLENLRSLAAKAKFYKEGDRLDNLYLTLTTGLMSSEREAEGNPQHQANIKAFLAKVSKIPKADESSSEILETLQEDVVVPYSEESTEEPTSVQPSPVSAPVSEAGDPEVYFRLVDEKCDRRRFFTTDKGYMGLGPEGMLPGDTVCIFFGGDTPYVLRKVEGSWKFVGECYVHGIMRGEAVEGLQDDAEGEVFEIR